MPFCSLKPTYFVQKCSFAYKNNLFFIKIKRVNFCGIASFQFFLLQLSKMDIDWSNGKCMTLEIIYQVWKSSRISFYFYFTARLANAVFVLVCIFYFSMHHQIKNTLLVYVMFLPCLINLYPTSKFACKVFISIYTVFYTWQDYKIFYVIN